MIWSLIKLVLGMAYVTIALMFNAFTWLLYYGWNSDMYTLWWTDKEAGIQYYYNCNGNIIPWAFQMKDRADSKFYISVNDHPEDNKK